MEVRTGLQTIHAFPEGEFVQNSIVFGDRLVVVTNHGVYYMELSKAHLVLEKGHVALSEFEKEG